jgi:type I restriction enzyme M protein
MDQAQIEWGDTINNPLLVENDQLMKFDRVVANPPFSLAKWGADKAEEDRYKRFLRGVPPRNKGDYAFILHMIETLKPKSGRGVIIVPHGVLFRGAAEGRIRQQLLDENIIDAVIGIPAGLFQTTGIPVAILVIDRSREKGGERESEKDILFIEASKEFRPGKAQNHLDDEHIEKIFDTFTNRKEIEKFSRLVPASEIAENDYNLNITRYVDTFEEEEPVDIQATLERIEELKPQIAKLEEEMEGYLQKLGIKK